MVLARVHAAAILGVEAFPVDVEVDIQDGLPSFSTVGLPDAAVRESRDRVRSALLNTGYALPEGRVTVNLAPADLRKEGSSFDLAIAVGLIAAAGRLDPAAAGEVLLAGELSLDGSLKAVRGALPVAVAAGRRGCRGIVVPPLNAREAALAGAVEVYQASSLAEVAAFLSGASELPRADGRRRVEGTGHDDGPDFAEVRGQESVKRALEVTAAGGHNVLMMGPPGSGKTMLARRLPGILPAMTHEESLETTRIHSVAGLLLPESPLLRRRPFRAPHHTVSAAGLVGGGAVPRPGEVTLAHNGVLFLDETPEFPSGVLDSLRQPLEDGRVTIVRSAMTLAFPADFMVVAAMNPCKCGWRGEGTRPCRCSAAEVRRYRGRLSGPLLDRIDVHVEVPALNYDDFAGPADGEPSAAIAARVGEARERQKRRLGGARSPCNAAMGPREMRRCCTLDARGDDLLRSAVERLHLTARGACRVLKVARTIADLAGAEKIGTDHLAEAVQYRSASGTEVP